MKNNLKSYVVCGDQHAPFHDKRLHEKFLKFLKDFKPDGFLINGDFVDLYSISRHIRGVGDLVEDGSLIKLRDEFHKSNLVLDDYDRALPKGCEKIFHDGNHESRLSRYFATAFNAVLDGMFTVDGILKLEKRKYAYKSGYPDNYTNLGRLTVSHGISASQYCAAGHLNLYRGSVAVNHTHTSQVFYVGGLASKQVGICIGHMADPKSLGMSYAKQIARWVQGFLIVYISPSGEFWFELINAYDGRLIYNKKEY